MMNSNTSTLHLMIIWSNAKQYKDYIIGELRQEFVIYKVFNITWEPKLFSRNLSIFYAHSLKDFSLKKATKIIDNKLRNIGDGSFYAIIFEDLMPNFQRRETTSGDRIVNTHVFDIKSAFRKMTGGGSLIHCSDDAWETNKDLTVLFGTNIEDFTKKFPIHNENIEIFNADCQGAKGYRSLDSFYYVLNNTTKYCVLPGFDILPKIPVSKENCIVMLVEHRDYVTRLTNAKHLFKDESQPYYIVKIGNQDYTIVSRYVGDNFLDKAWEESIISKRINNNHSYYTPDDMNGYYSLLYHLLFHADLSVARDYLHKYVSELLHRQFKFDLLHSLEDISSFLQTNGYEIVSPRDKGVLVNKRNIKLVGFRDFLMQTSNVENITQVNTDYRSLSDYLYFSGELKGRKVFIKYGGVGESCQNEYNMTKRVYEFSPIHFVEPIEISTYGDKNYIIYEWVDGISIESYIKEHSNGKELLRKQFLEIYESLQRAQVMHRDIRPDNFVVVGNILKLIDFQYAIDLRKRKELKCVRDNNVVALHLGNENFRFKKYAWKDSVSILKVMCYFGFDVDDLNLSKDEAFNMNFVRYCMARIEDLWSRGLRKWDRINNTK